VGLGERKDVTVRRVGFRAGTDAELAAMHLVESEIESERHPGADAQPLRAYVAFARSLPPQFDDHTWVAEDGDGNPVGCAACWSNAAADPGVMESYVHVRRPWRRRGVGSRLARAVAGEARADGRATLVWSTYDAFSDADAFSRRMGGRVARVNRNSELLLEEVDWSRVQSWVDAGPRRAPGYALQAWDGPFPEHMIDDACRFHRIMNTQPRDDLEVGDVVLDRAQVAQLDRHLVESWRQRWTLFVRDPEVRCVGGTEVTFEPWQPGLAFQQNTATDPDHRGLGLAKWAKATMLLRLRRERPEVTRVRTGNAVSNGAMLAINEALGFRVTEVRKEWQGAVAEIDERLSTETP
jgi:GNAT superfamily N-acetyltransferase